MSLVTLNFTLKPVYYWMTDKVLDVLKEKGGWYYKCKQHENNEYCLNEFKRLRNTPACLMRKRKKEHHSLLIQQTDGNTQNICDVVRTAVELRSEGHILPDEVEQKNS